MTLVTVKGEKGSLFSLKSHFANTYFLLKSYFIKTLYECYVAKIVENLCLHSFEQLLVLLFLIIDHVSIYLYCLKSFILYFNY